MAKESSGIKIKICGLTNLEDARLSLELGADLLGFVFAKSPRMVTAEKAHEIVEQLPGTARKAGVFVNEKVDIVRETAEHCGLDVLQFHGEESPDYCVSFMPRRKVFKAFRLKDEESLAAIRRYRVDGYLLDSFVEGAHGGTGKTFDWQLAREAMKLCEAVILSGGLNCDNIGEAVKKVYPWMVDVSSGVEAKPGKKDPGKLKRFIEMVREAESGDRSMPGAEARK